MRQTLSITRKELDGYFSSPIALIFVGVFLSLTLFLFFWVDAFWERGLADVRPLFRWMPVLLIFLVATLTMRQWSEEEQTGTLEILFTMPMQLLQLVMGKFLSALALVAVALFLTLTLPLTVATLGDLDMGPVLGGYLASLLMASAYIAIGLFISSRTDNQIVALILTVLSCGMLHLAGTNTVTDFIGAENWLRGISTGSRFESIERGVLDIRDLAYYVSLTVVFLTLNVISLDSKRWGSGKQLSAYRYNASAMTILVVLNLFVANLILAPLTRARIDLTEDQQYSLSEVTEDVLSDLDEPLLIRAYISDDNHPLLNPLIPQVTDLLREYEIAAGDQMTLEIVDPITEPELESEANQIYGIRPSPLQVSDRSGSQILNIYFDILIRYGDQSDVLNFGQLIEVDQFAAGDDFQVRLRNLEYDLTSSILRSVSGFQSTDAVLAGLSQPAEVTLYVTPSTLPESLADAPEVIQTVIDDLGGGDQLIYTVVDLDDPNSGVTEQQLFDQYEMRPLALDFFSDDVFYLYLVVEVGNDFELIPPQGEISEAEIRTGVETALKRFSDGFLQVVGLWTPSQTVDQFGQPQQSLQSFLTLQQELQANFEVQPVTFDSGVVPAGVDVLLIIDPKQMTDLDRFAIDQFLMRGGSVLVAAGSYNIAPSPTGGLGLAPVTEGVEAMLSHYGVTIEPSLVLDPQSGVLPLQTQRGNVQEIELFDYPFFVDVREDGMNKDNSILTGLPTVVMGWSSPLTVTAGVNAEVLLQSTSDAWLTTETSNIVPNFELFPPYGFPVTGEQNIQLLGVAVEDSFTSYFTDREIPSDPLAADPNVAPAPEAETSAEPTRSVLTQSPQDTKLIVLGSSEFLNDTVFNLTAGFVAGDSYINGIRLIQNAVEWFNEDQRLASIRAKGGSVRVLDSLEDDEQNQWEIVNYVVALLALIVLGGIFQLNKRAEQPIPLEGYDE